MMVCAFYSSTLEELHVETFKQSLGEVWGLFLRYLFGSFWDMFGMLTFSVGFATLLDTFREGFFEGVWALHTTVIIAADQREVGNLVRIRAPKSTDAANFAEMLRFLTLL